MDTDFLVENPSTRGFTCLSAQLPYPAARLERAQCALCGGDEIYAAEAAGSFGLRKHGGFATRQTVFTALVCAACGYVQWHAPVDEYERNWLQKKARRVQPQTPQ